MGRAKDQLELLCGGKKEREREGGRETERERERERERSLQVGVVEKPSCCLVQVK